MLKELYLADNFLLRGLVPDIPGLVVLDITGTDLYLVKSGSTTSRESITTDSETFLKPDESKTAQPISLLIIVLSSVGA
jgi:hypothetical protein